MPSLPSPFRAALIQAVAVCTVAMSVALSGGAAELASGPPSPSVLLITIDTLRADHVGCYGYTQVETPVIDALAAQGGRFENAYAQAPITLPSHAVILTGTYPMYNGVRDFTSSGLPVTIPTLAEMLTRRVTAPPPSSVPMHSIPCGD